MRPATLMPLFRLFGCQVPAQEVLRIVASVREYKQAAATGVAFSGQVVAPRQAINALLGAADFSFCTGDFLDPFAGCAEIGQAFQQELGVLLYSNELNVGFNHSGICFSCDAYDGMLYHAVAPEVIVCAPPVDQLDLAVPALPWMASVLVCMFVPVSWVASAPSYRRRWLRKLAAEGRLHILMGVSGASSDACSAWVLVFASELVKQQMLRCGEDCSPLLAEF